MSFVPAGSVPLVLVAGNDGTDGKFSVYTHNQADSQEKVVEKATNTFSGNPVNCGIMTLGAHFIVLGLKNTPFLSVYKDMNTTYGNFPDYESSDLSLFDHTPSGAVKWVMAAADCRWLAMLVDGGASSDQIWTFRFNTHSQKYIKFGQIDCTDNDTIGHSATVHMDKCAISIDGKVVSAIQTGTTVTYGRAVWQYISGTYTFLDYTGFGSSPTAGNMLCTAVIAHFNDVGEGDATKNYSVLWGKTVGFDGVNFSADFTTHIGAAMNSFGGAPADTVSVFDIKQCVGDLFGQGAFANFSNSDSTNPVVIGYVSDPAQTGASTVNDVELFVGLPVGIESDLLNANGFTNSIFSCMSVNSDGHTLQANSNSSAPQDGSSPLWAQTTVDFGSTVNTIRYWQMYDSVVAGQLLNATTPVKGRVASSTYGTVGSDPTIQFKFSFDNSPLYTDDDGFYAIPMLTQNIFSPCAITAIADDDTGLNAAIFSQVIPVVAP